MREELREVLSEEIAWQGDLEDDCMAEWRGMVAHCEAMDEDEWYYAVHRIDPDCEGHGRGGKCSCLVIWHSGDLGSGTHTGAGARSIAERIMRVAAITDLIEREPQWEIAP